MVEFIDDDTLLIRFRYNYPRRNTFEVEYIDGIFEFRPVCGQGDEYTSDSSRDRFILTEEEVTALAELAED